MKNFLARYSLLPKLLIVILQSETESIIMSDVMAVKQNVARTCMSSVCLQTPTEKRQILLI